MESKYQWKINSFGKKINPDDALLEIQKAETIFGKITAENVLKIASNEDSSLHGLFEWDDTKAGQQYRLQQARNVINNIEVKIITDNEPVFISVYEIVNMGEGNQYKHIETLTLNERQYIKENTIKAIGSLKIKLKIYNEFNKVIQHLDSAISELELQEFNP